MFTCGFAFSITPAPYSSGRSPRLGKIKSAEGARPLRFSRACTIKEDKNDDAERGSEITPGESTRGVRLESVMSGHRAMTGSALAWWRHILWCSNDVWHGYGGEPQRMVRDALDVCVFTIL